MDSRGTLLEPKQKILYTRLNKIQKSFITTLERNLWEARPFLTNICSRLTMPSVIQETAWRIYVEVAKKKLTCGRKIKAFVAASLYAAIRVHDIPYLMEEVAKISTISIHHIHKYLSIIVQYILPEIHLQYKSMGLKMLVYRFGEDLKLSIATQQKAYTLLQTVKRRGLWDKGIDPKGLAAAVLYISIRKSNEKRTQTEITKIAGITEVTLRTRVKQITFFINK
jgi:transcription initiation factor TFIIB